MAFLPNQLLGIHFGHSSEVCRLLSVSVYFETCFVLKNDKYLELWSWYSYTYETEMPNMVLTFLPLSFYGLSTEYLEYRFGYDPDIF